MGNYVSFIIGISIINSSIGISIIEFCIIDYSNVSFMDIELFLVCFPFEKSSLYFSYSLIYFSRFTGSDIAFLLSFKLFY